MSDRRKPTPQTAGVSAASLRKAYQNASAAYKQKPAYQDALTAYKQQQAKKALEQTLSKFSHRKLPLECS
jgi:hypothetical protein